ncbi:MAG: DUF1566 domain-containing protein [Syntrophaceae bacterium]|jgi:hypothetical protein|nr:DUF1566 domain-containing protein [Syntrophaceae bacterium]HOC59211.1 DUF1566 domain-containing protein [Smithellaceae bacterium]HQM45253.1 DUF1566 domain-containing protein [Smithellaceae bacterium]
MRKTIYLAVLLTFIICFPHLILAETIEVLIKGIDNGIRTSRDRDYQEAVMNAKLQAIERAGVSVQSMTKVENFQLKFDMVESRAKAVLLPGFQIIDIGYQKDGTYQVVLSGKVQVGETKSEQSKLWGKLRSQPTVFATFQQASQSWNSALASPIENKYVNNEDGTISDLKTGLMWMYSYDIRENTLEVKQDIDQINKKKFAGYSDWRIPTLHELASLIEQKPGGKMSGGRQSYLDPIFDVKTYCWHLWSADRCNDGYFMVNVGEKAGGLSVPGDHYQSEGVCVACLKAVRSIK